jgi:hypothetical protein
VSPSKIENTAVFWQFINRGEDGWPKQIGIKAVEIAQDEIAIDHAGYLWLRSIHNVSSGSTLTTLVWLFLVQTKAGRGHGT